MHETGNGEPVLRFPIDHGVTAGDDTPRLGDLVDRALEDAFELRKRRVFGPRGDVEREQHLAAHRVHV